MDWQTLYIQLGRLIQTMPALDMALTPEHYQWLGRASALVAQAGDVLDMAELNVGVQGLDSGHAGIRADSMHKVKAVLYRALARAELAAPAPAQGAFIPVGGDLDAFAAIGKVLSRANSGVLIIDPYLDEIVLTDFAGSAPEGVPLRLLADQQGHKPTLAPAAKRWVSQYGDKRPLEARLTGPRVLHDRLLVLDGANVWSLTQSLKDFAGRSPASIIRVDAETAALKVTAYEAMWRAATPLSAVWK